DAGSAGWFDGSPVDIQDGFIHFSLAGQAARTAALHFAGAHDLVIVAFDENSFGDVRYEPSRGGDLFPHLYGPLDPKKALWVKPLPLGKDGRHVFPDLAPGSAP
ncbi:MAG TPA: DUF952 domain-containing protein, partial [Opitutus sp.]|nr:DUF952 domain-containing protein [Opitutus sp.]